uniref:Uncharacterized protein n=1 Tax=Rhizophagus irregularis (strain DAOM 181602 / DAOM 197198 / MUCL 43194) TaxID=747089 RepID=U9UU31_RHIID
MSHLFTIDLFDHDAIIDSGYSKLTNSMGKKIFLTHLLRGFLILFGVSKLRVGYFSKSFF